MKKKKDKITIRSSTEEYFERLLERIREIRFSKHAVITFLLQKWYEKSISEEML